MKDSSILDILNALDALQDEIQAFKNLANTASFLSKLESHIQHEIGLGDIYLENDDIPGSEKLGVDFFGMSLSGIMHKPFQITDEAEIKFGDISYISDGVFSLGINIKTTVSLSYCIDYYDYHHLPLSRKKSVEISSMNGDGICDASEIVLARLHGFIDFKSKNKDLTKEKITAMIDDFPLFLEECEINLEIDSAEILEC